LDLSGPELKKIQNAFHLWVQEKFSYQEIGGEPLEA
jgi:hypothetical protein